MCLDHIVALWFWIKRLCTNFNLYWFLVVAAASFYLEKSNQSQANVRALLSAQFIFGSYYNSQLIIWKMWDEVSFSKFSFYWGRKVFYGPVKLRLWTDPSAGTDVPFISVAVIIEMIRKQIIPRLKGDTHPWSGESSQRSTTGSVQLAASLLSKGNDFITRSHR